MSGDPNGSAIPVRVLVEVFQNSEGAVRSVHRPASPEDAERMQGWPSGGLAQVGHAMFIEALRRESYTMAITQLSAGRKPEELSKEDLAEHVRSHWMKMLESFAELAAEEALEMIRGAEERSSGDRPTGR